jgi:hypothetical protein
MSSKSADGPDAPLVEEPPAPQQRVAARTIDPDDGPVECTLYPEGLTGYERMSTWITAREGSFVSLDDWR